MCDPADVEGSWLDSWAVLEEFYNQGKLKAIGVCNVRLGELNELLTVAKIKPHIVQNWMDPLHQDVEVRGVCAEHGIVYQAYSTLGTQHAAGGDGTNPILEHPRLHQLAQQLGQGVAQVVLKWALQHGVGVLPRSSSEEHMRRNLQLDSFTLTPEQMQLIDQIEDPRDVRRRGRSQAQSREVDLGLPLSIRDQQVHVRWIANDGSSSLIGQLSSERPSFRIQSYTGHEFEGRSDDGRLLVNWQVGLDGEVEVTKHNEL